MDYYNAVMNSVIVALAISNEEFSRLYRGEAREVICSAKDGRVIQFPASHLKQFLTHDGVYGEFEIHFTRQYKLIKIVRLN